MNELHSKSCFSHAKSKLVAASIEIDPNRFPKHQYQLRSNKTRKIGGKNNSNTATQQTQSTFDSNIITRCPMPILSNETSCKSLTASSDKMQNITVTTNTNNDPECNTLEMGETMPSSQLNFSTNLLDHENIKRMSVAKDNINTMTSNVLAFEQMKKSGRKRRTLYNANEQQQMLDNDIDMMQLEENEPMEVSVATPVYAFLRKMWDGVVKNVCTASHYQTSVHSWILVGTESIYGYFMNFFCNRAHCKHTNFGHARRALEFYKLHGAKQTLFTYESKLQSAVSKHTQADACDCHNWNELVYIFLLFESSSEHGKAISRLRIFEAGLNDALEFQDIIKVMNHIHVFLPNKPGFFFLQNLNYS